MPGCARWQGVPTCVKGCQGNKMENQAKMQGNEHMRGLIS